MENESEITDFIIEFATNYIDTELVREYFHGCKAFLKKVPIGKLAEGDKNQNIKSLKKERFYEKLSHETMPPLIVEDGEVLDGNHRLRIAKKLNLTDILIYDVLEI